MTVYKETHPDHESNTRTVIIDNKRFLKWTLYWGPELEKLLDEDTSISSTARNFLKRCLAETSIGLNYEIFVYGEIIRNLHHLHISNLFPRLIMGSTYITQPDFRKKYRGYNSNLNSLYYRCGKQYPFKVSKMKDTHLPLSYIELPIFEKGKSWGEFIKHSSIHSFRSCLFQICIGLLTLEYAKMVHHDLHPGNIYIEKLPKPVDISYVIDDQVFTLKDMGYHVRIYDFDFSYAINLGENRKLGDWVCKDPEYEICNQFIPKRDFVHMIVSTKMTTKSRTFCSILQQVFGSFNLNSIRSLKQKTQLMHSRNAWSQIHDVRQAIDVLAQMMPNVEVGLEHDLEEEMYVLDRRMFDPVIGRIQRLPAELIWNVWEEVRTIHHSTS